MITTTIPYNFPMLQLVTHRHRHLLLIPSFLLLHVLLLLLELRPPPVCNAAAFSELRARRSYAYFPGQPRWARQIPMTLTYALSPDNIVPSPPISDIRVALWRSFSRWAAVIPVAFSEADDYYTADIKIGFYRGDHGDGEPFDGVLGILAHSFSPETGNLHFDADETWAVDFGVEKSDVAIDLESVALHEIGHLLGLAHSADERAVMYPSLKPRKKKLGLTVDDVRGVQALYGSNPNFTFKSSLESDISTSQAVDFRQRVSPQWAMIFLSCYSFAFVI